MKIICWLGFGNPSESVKIGPREPALVFLLFLTRWLSTLTFLTYTLAVVRFRYLIRDRIAIHKPQLLIFLFYVSGLSNFLIPQALPFALYLVLLALLGNLRAEWYERHSKNSNTQEF